MADEQSAAIPFPQLRLRRHADYQRAYNASHKQHSREMSYFAARRDAMPSRRLHPDEASMPPSGPRIGLTVGKVMGKAHDRNRIKRRLRSAVAKHAGELQGLPMDLILHPRRSVLRLEWESLQREVQQVFRAARKGFHAPPAPAPIRAQTGPPGQGAKPNQSAGGNKPSRPAVSRVTR